MTPVCKPKMPKAPDPIDPKTLPQPAPPAPAPSPRAKSAVVSALKSSSARSAVRRRGVSQLRTSDTSRESKKK